MVILFVWLGIQRKSLIISRVVGAVTYVLFLVRLPQGNHHEAGEFHDQDVGQATAQAAALRRIIRWAKSVGPHFPTHKAPK